MLDFRLSRPASVDQRDDDAIHSRAFDIGRKSLFSQDLHGTAAAYLPRARSRSP